jgi:hypothetical protein
MDGKARKMSENGHVLNFYDEKKPAVSQKKKKKKKKWHMAVAVAHGSSSGTWQMADGRWQ